MHLAFYAPMKPPGHPVPSGDRSIARSLIAAFEHMGASVCVASELQTRDRSGDTDRQRELIASAETEIDRLVPLGRAAGWQAWVTYHNYYKAPDLIGPNVSRSLGIPYLQIESTRARKRLNGPWHAFAQAAEAATDAAEVIFYFTKRDAVGLEKFALPHQHLIHLPPFLAKTDAPYASVSNGPMLSVGMMRAGDKLASYRIIAQTLALLPTSDWRLEIAGDGPKRADVEQLMAPFGSRVRFLEELEPDAMQRVYQNASLLLWPGVNEALGMVFLEAQAAGLPIVAQNRPGMRELLAPANYPDQEDGAAGLAKYLSKVLIDNEVRQRLGAEAYAYVCDNHLMKSACKTLQSGLSLAGVHL